MKLPEYFGQNILWRKDDKKDTEPKREDIIGVGLIHTAEWRDETRAKIRNLKSYVDNLSENGRSFDAQKKIKGIIALLEEECLIDSQAAPLMKITTGDIAFPSDNDDETNDGEEWKIKAGYQDENNTPEIVTVPKVILKHPEDEKERAAFEKRYLETHAKLEASEDQFEQEHPVEFLEIKSFLPTENRTN